MKGGEELGEIPVPNLSGTGEGTLANCTLEFVPGGVIVKKADGSILEKIPISDLTGEGSGSLSLSNCTLTFSEDGTSAKVLMG